MYPVLVTGKLAELIHDEALHDFGFGVKQVKMSRQSIRNKKYLNPDGCHDCCRTSIGAFNDGCPFRRLSSSPIISDLLKPFIALDLLDKRIEYLSIVSDKLFN